jgi:hypothetical protein
MYRGVLIALQERHVPLERVSSGMERYFGTVQMTALAPSVTLRNRYHTYGVDINNASIVLRLENRESEWGSNRSTCYQGTVDTESNREAGKSTMILGGDADLDSWELISNEFNRVSRPSRREPDVQKMVNPLACRVLKVAHHGSMDCSSLDILERMSPSLAIISTKQERSKAKVCTACCDSSVFPHPHTSRVLEQVGAKVLLTDASATAEDPENAHEGSVIVVIPPGGTARWRKLGDREDQLPEILDAV